MSSDFGRLAIMGTSTSRYYDPTIKAFANQTKAEDYMTDLKSCYDKLKAVAQNRLPNFKFKLIEVELEE
jgi:hypothetical protein